MGERIGSSFRAVTAAGMLLGAAGLAVALHLLMRGSILFGVAVVAITWFLFRWFWRVTLRKRELMRRGFHVGERVGNHWVYEEIQAGEIVSIEFPLDYVGRGDYDIRVPGEHRWAAAMPGWAQGRRAEILERLQSVFKFSQIRVDADAG